MLEPNTFCNSWIVVSKETGKPVLETYNNALIMHINSEKYDVYTAHEWLVLLNKRLAAQKAQCTTDV